jgi:hypothetical protein
MALSGAVVEANSGCWLTYSAPILFDQEGTTTAVYRSLDIAGNSEAVQTTTVSLDSVLPTTTASLIDFGEGVTVTLTAVDTTSGLDTTFYRLDAGSWQTYDQPILLTAGITVTVEFYSLDIAGNQEAVNTQIVPTTDTIAPTTTAVLSPTAISGWHRTPVSVSLAATDGLSGVVATYYRLNHGLWQTYLDPFTLTTDGTYQLDYYSQDVVGNVEMSQTLIIQIDQVSPQSAVTSAPTAVDIGPIPITWSASDSGSGIEMVYLWVQFDMGSWTLSSLSQDSNNGEFEFLPGQGEGTYCFQTQAIDVAGNEQTAPEGSGEHCTIYSTDMSFVIYLPLITK